MGGGAIRAAAKAAGITAAGGIRSMTSENYSAARKVASVLPASSKTEEIKQMTMNSEAGVQRPYLELDDWVFPDAEEAVADRMPRVVFGGLPSLQEAKEATFELSTALEKTYLTTPNSVGKASSAAADNDSYEDVLETKACLTTQIVVAPVPAPAIMAFKFLHESSNAKNVVASIACDPNVWNAVLQNDELQQFLQSQTASDPQADMNFSMASFADYDGADKNSRTSSVAENDPEGLTGSSKLADYEFVSGVTEVYQKMKSNVADMVNSLSDYMQNLFGVQGGGSGVLVNSVGTSRASADAVMQASFMGLAVMAILVILLKRTN